MRKTFVAAALGLFLSMAAVAAPDEQTPESRAYLSFSFGGNQPGIRALRYGLRLDHDRFFTTGDQPLPALMQLDFSRRGLSAIQVNGLNVLRPAYRRSQNEDSAEAAPTEETEEAEAEEAVAEEEGFFESIGSWFGGLFGDDEEEAAEVAQAGEAGDEEAAADDEPVEDGPFMTYEAVDWGLLAVGLAGIGFIATEVAEGDDDGDPPPPPVTPVDCIISPGDLDPNGNPDGCTAFAGRQDGVAGRSVDPEYQEWLNSGTGQMGDLQAR